MKLLRSFLTALVLVAGIFASAHMALEHGGDMSGKRATCLACGPDDDGQDSAADGEHHHHDLSAVRTGKTFQRQAWQPAALVSELPGENFVAQLAALLNRALPSRTESFASDSPPDERSSGWLLVCRTALPARGPSLAA